MLHFVLQRIQDGSKRGAEGSDAGVWTTVEGSWEGAGTLAQHEEVADSGDSVTELSPKPADAMPTFEEETIRRKKLTSVVWKTFTPISSSGLRDGLIDSAKCSVCSKIFSTRHGTSSMMRHAKRHTEFPQGTACAGKKGKKSANGVTVNVGEAAVVETDSVAPKKAMAVKKETTAEVHPDEHAAGTNGWQGVA